MSGPHSSSDCDKHLDGFIFVTFKNHGRENNEITSFIIGRMYHQKKLPEQFSPHVDPIQLKGSFS